MINLNDPIWSELNGGYRTLFNPTQTLKQLQSNPTDCELWNKLWENLHHQGDVGEASYAVVPTLVNMQQQCAEFDWNFYALISTIEIERHRKSNPKLPKWLKEEYELAWKILPEIAIRDLKNAENSLAIRSILGALALTRGDVKLGIFISYTDEPEIEDTLEDRDAWSETYREQIAAGNSQG